MLALKMEASTASCHKGLHGLQAAFSAVFSCSGPWYTSVYGTSCIYKLFLQESAPHSPFPPRPRSLSVTVFALSGLGLLAACASVPCTCKVCAGSLFLAGSCGCGFRGTRSVSEVPTGVEWHRQNLQHLTEGSRQTCTKVDWTLRFSAVCPAFRRWRRSA